VGKTAIAAALSCARGTKLIRLQCFEGIDAASAVYEWNYAQQLLWIRLNEQRPDSLNESDIYNEPLLLERPLLKSIRQDKAPVPPIDLVESNAGTHRIQCNKGGGLQYTQKRRPSVACPPSRCIAPMRQDNECLT
jgi:hypothetical protein